MNYNLVVILFAISFSQGWCWWWSEPAEAVAGEARRAVAFLNTSLAQTRAQLGSRGLQSGSAWTTCSNLTDTLDQAERLLLAGAVIAFDADNDLFKIIHCRDGETKSKCFSRAIDGLPDYLEKYSLLISCYWADVKLKVAQANYFFWMCLSSSQPSPDDPIPAPSPEDVERCEGQHV